MTPPTKLRHRPFVPETMKMEEFTWRALLLGLIMCVVLGAANAYLGLKAGQTIAASSGPIRYPTPRNAGLTVGPATVVMPPAPKTCVEPIGPSRSVQRPIYPTLKKKF